MPFPAITQYNQYSSSYEFQDLSDGRISLKTSETQPLTADDSPLPLPPGYFRWVMLLISCLFSVGSYFAYDAVGVVEESIEENFNISQEQFGLLYSVYSIPNIILPFFGGILLDRIGLPIGTVVYTFLIMVGAVIVALAPYTESFYVMLVGRFIFGVGAESSYVAQSAICCVWFHRGDNDGKILAFAMGIVLSAGRLGSFTTFAANSGIVEYFGTYVAALWAGAAFSAVCFLAGIVYAFLHHRYAPKTKGVLAAQKINVRDILLFPFVLFLAASICCIYYSVIFPFQSTAVALLTRTQNMDEKTAGYYVSVLPATSLFLSPVFGYIVDRVGLKIYFILAGLGLMVPAFLLLNQTWWPSLISFVVLGLCFSIVPAAIWPCIPILIEDRLLGTAFGVMSSVMNAGLTLAFWLQGKFQTTDGSTETYLYSAMVVIGIVLTILWLFLDVRRMRSKCNERVAKGS